MTNNSDHGDLILLAIVVSIALHAVIMFFAAPHVMSRTVTTAFEAKRAPHRPPMSVRRFEGDPLRERVKTEPKSDVPAPHEAPKAATSDGPVALSDAKVDNAYMAEPVMQLPEIVTGPEDVAVELPKPSVPESSVSAAAAESVPPMPSAVPLVPAAADSAVPALASADESFIPSPGAAAPAPVFTLPDVGNDKVSSMAEVLPAKAAPKVEYVFDNKVLESVNEGFVEKEKAAVRELISASDAAPAESSIDCTVAAAVDPADPKWRYFKVSFRPKTGANALRVVPKDAVILIDASGSIGSDRLKRCRNVAKEILRSCFNSGDRFNLVAFRNSFSYAFREWRECDAPSFEAADRWLSRLTAHGRTDVFSVISSVLTLPRDPARPLIALVVTDGDANTGISGTAEILSRFAKLNDGLVSVYMYGVKKEANRKLIDMLTRSNRGESFIHTGSRFSSGANLESLAAAFRDPLLTDMRIAFAAGSEAETYPRLLKNLYRNGSVELRGRCPVSVKELVFTLQGLSGKDAYDALYRIDFKSAEKADSALPSEWREERALALEIGRAF